MLLYYQSWMFYNHFISFFWYSPIDIVPSASCCFLHVFYIAEYQYQTESKHSETLRRFFMDQKTPNGPRQHLRGAPRGAQPTRVRQEAQARPGGLCPPRDSPGPPLCSINTPIFQKP